MNGKRVLEVGAGALGSRVLTSWAPRLIIPTEPGRLDLATFCNSVLEYTLDGSTPWMVVQVSD